MTDKMRIENDFTVMYGKDMNSAPTQEIKDYMVKLLDSLNINI